MKSTKRNGWFRFLRILANDTKLKFKVGSPATDGKTVWLPALPAELTEEDLVLFKGDSFHEVGHIMYSDISYFMEFAKQGMAHRFLLNAIDDVFMEGECSSWKKMAEDYIRQSTQILIKRNQFINGSKSLVEALGAFILVYLTAKRWPEIGEPLATITSNLEMHLGQHAPVVIPELMKLLDDEFPNVKSTRDAGALTLKVINLLEDLAEQDQSESDPKPPAEDDSGDGEGSQPNDDPADDAGSESGSGSSGSGDQSGSSAGSKGDKGEEDDVSGEGESGSGAGQEQSEESRDSNDGKGSEAGDAQEGDDSEGASGTDGSEEPEDQAKTGKPLKQLVEEMLNSEVGDEEIFDKAKAVEALAEEIAKGEHPDYKGEQPVGDLEVGGIGAGALVELTDGIVTLPRDKSAARKLKNEVLRSNGKDIAKLRALLSSSVDAEPYSARNGRLGEQYLHRFALDDNRLFERTEERMLPKASVSIAADLSGSTRYEIGNSTIAKEIQRAMFMLETVLDGIGAPREMFGFAPITGGDNSIIRTFNDNHTIACERIGAMDCMVGGISTPICTAVEQAAARLNKQHTQHKLLFVVTDGAPSDEERAKVKTAEAQAMGITVFYFVISPFGGHTHWLRDTNVPVVQITSAGQLFSALSEKLSDYMR